MALRAPWPTRLGGSQGWQAALATARLGITGQTGEEQKVKIFEKMQVNFHGRKPADADRVLIVLSRPCSGPFYLFLCVRGPMRISESSQQQVDRHPLDFRGGAYILG